MNSKIETLQVQVIAFHIVFHSSCLPSDIIFVVDGGKWFCSKLFASYTYFSHFEESCPCQQAVTTCLMLWTYSLYLKSVELIR